MSAESIASILGHWIDDPRAYAWQSWNAPDSFSGSRLWRVTRREEALLLRRYPLEFSPHNARLLEIHALQRHLADCGPGKTPVPHLARCGSSLVGAGSHLWELSDWLPGEATYETDPHPDKLTAAFRHLAQIHIAAATCPPVSAAGPSPGLSHRREHLQRLQREGPPSASPQVTSGQSDEATWASCEAVRNEACALLSRWLASLQRGVGPGTKVPDLPLQWCLRDVRCQHLLFEGTCLTGLIDFGAAAIDSVACDLARLLDDMPLQTPSEHTQALEAYQSVRPLQAAELEALADFSALNLPLSVANWLQWIGDERRFAADLGRQHQAVVRLTQLTQRLRRRLGGG